MKKKHLNKLCLLALGFIISAIPVSAENWIQVESDFQIDTDSINKYYLPDRENSYVVNTKDYHHIDKENDVDYVKFQLLFDCNDSTKFTIKSGKYYKKNGEVEDKGAIANKYLEWSNMDPSSMAFAAFNYVCNPKNAKIATTNNSSSNSNINNTQNIDSSSIYKQALPSMLYIETNNATGSGVILKEDGTFVTCFHVIAEADSIKVKTSTGEEYYVDGFKYINPLDDVAILTIKNTNKLFKPIKIPQNKSIIGEKVYTLSNPKGLEFSFSDGMISNISKDYIQFTAPVTHGSSGGSLLNNKGNLLGIITSGFNEGNINFALPNEYYLSKLNNMTIKNTKNEKWQEFVFNNANEDQFKLTLQYALNKNNYNLLYKYFKPYTYRSDFPNEALADIAFIATYVAIVEGNEIAKKDAIAWYEKLIKNPETEEVAAFSLFSFYSYEDNEIEGKKIEKILKKYPKSYNIFMDLVTEEITPEKFGEKYWERLYYLTYHEEMEK